MTGQRTFRAALGAALVAAAAGPAANGLTVTGLVRAHEETIVQSEAAGIVDRIHVREGEQVAAGQVLVELRNERQTIALDLSRAGLARAEALVKETTVLLENGEKELERVLIAADALPRKEVEDRQHAVQRLKASLSAQMAELARAEQEVRLREHDLRETRLLAPFAGVITQIRIHRGDTLRPMDTPVVELVNLERLYVEVLVPGHEAQRIRQGQPARILVEREWMGRRGRLTGHVSYINPTVDAASRMVRLKVDIPNPNGTVRPGMLAEVQF